MTTIQEALRQLKEEKDFENFANYCTELWVFNDILKNKRILTNFNQKSARDFDFRGNHICLTHNIINPPAIMPNLQFGIVINEEKLKNLITSYPTKARKVPKFGLSNENNSEDDYEYLSTHEDSRYRRYEKNTKNKKNKAQGMFIRGIAYVSGTYYLDFKQWLWREIPKTGDRYSSDVEDLMNLIKGLFDILAKKQEDAAKTSALSDTELNTLINNLFNNKTEMCEALKPSKKYDPDNTILKKLIEYISTWLKSATDYDYDNFKKENITINTEDGVQTVPVTTVLNWYGGDDTKQNNKEPEVFRTIVYWLNSRIPLNKKLFIRNADNQNDPLIKLYFPNSKRVVGENGQLSGNDYIYVVGADDKAGITTSLRTKPESVDQNCCIKLISTLDSNNNIESTTYTLPEINQSGYLTENQVYALDHEVLEENEYRLYTPEVDTKLQKGTDFENIENAYFKFDDDISIITRLILPDIYSYRADPMNDKSKILFRFKLQEWLARDNNWNNNVILSCMSVGDDQDKYDDIKNAYLIRLKNDLSDLIKNLKEYKAKNIPIKFYTAKVNDNLFNTITTSYLDDVTIKNTFNNIDKIEDHDKEKDIKAYPSSTYKMINPHADNNIPPILPHKEWNHVIHGPQYDSFVKLENIKGKDNIARLQTACIVYTDNLEDKQNPYILLYDDQDHWDIPHGGVKGKDDLTQFKTLAIKKVEDETGLILDYNLVQKANFNYYYYENAAGFLKNVEQPTWADKKWMYYYNILYIGKYDKKNNDQITKGQEDCRWFKLSDIYNLSGSKCHIKEIINNAEPIILKNI